MVENQGQPPEDGSSDNEAGLPSVIVSFSGYKPPFDPVPIVRRMLASVPKKYLAGLETVVLCNASGLSGKRSKTRLTHRKRKLSLAGAAGAYHPAYRGNRAWIEIFIDNALRGWETGLWLRIAFIREGRLSNVLFHEIGHHIHYAIRPERREKEDVADVWKVRLDRNYARQRFRFWGVVARIVRPLFGRYLDTQFEKAMSRELKYGAISRAEYQETLKDRL